MRTQALLAGLLFAAAGASQATQMNGASYQYLDADRTFVSGGLDGDGTHDYEDAVRRFRLSGFNDGRSIHLASEASIKGETPVDSAADPVYAGTGANSYESVEAATGGRIRYTLRYELYADGAGTSARLKGNFWGSSLAGLSDPADAFELSLTGDATGGKTLSGSFTSDWLGFASQAELDEVFGGGSSYGRHVTAWTEINGMENLVRPGDYDSYAKVWLTSEIAPVPEPETYALFGTGLTALYLARRRARAART